MRLSCLAMVTLLLWSLFLAGGAVARCFGVPDSRTGEVLWSVPMEAVSASGYADDAVFGVAEGATNLFDPSLDEFERAAPEGAGLRLFLFQEQVLKFPPAKLNVSFIAPADRMDWTLRVEYRDSQPSEVTLTWDSSEVTGASEPVSLRLLDGPVTVDMLSEDSYSFIAEPGTRSFIVVAEPLPPEVSLFPIALVMALYVLGLGILILLRKRRRQREAG